MCQFTGYPKLNKSNLKKRVDVLLLDQGLVETREQGQSLIMAGKVYADGHQVTKPGIRLNTTANLSVSQGLPYVSRGGIKLSHALDMFGIDPSGMVTLDIGASTGGFTDCLIQRGSSKVYALDVGKGQLDYRLRNNPRVSIMEKINAHYPFEIPEKVSVITIDVSFISLTKIIPNVFHHITKSGVVIALVKPQFEVRKSKVGKKGVIKDPHVHAEAISDVILWAINQGIRLRNITPSPIFGAAGNREFFILLEFDPELSYETP